MSESGKPRRRWPWVLGLLVLVLIGVRAALPYWVTNWVNGKIDRMGGYRGHVEEINVHLWKGAYTAHDLTVEKVDGSAKLPLLKAPETEIGLSWKALFDGRIVATSQMRDPEINFIDGEGDEDQTGMGVDWKSELESLAPFKLDEVILGRAKILFHNPATEPEVHLPLSQVDLTIKGMTSRIEAPGRNASFRLLGTLTEHAPLDLEGEFHSLTPLEDFRLQMKVEKFRLKTINEFLRAYANLDVISGSGEYLMELDVENGQLRGYAKPLFRDIQVFSWKQDVERQDDGPLRIFWESVVGGLENLLKNQEINQIATQVELDGNIDDPDLSTLQAIWGVLANAFGEAYEPQFEGLAEQEK